MPEIFNAEVLFREDATPDEFIDVIQGNRIYLPCLYVSLTMGNRVQKREKWGQIVVWLLNMTSIYV